MLKMSCDFLVITMSIYPSIYCVFIFIIVQTADVEEMECELHSKEFFVQVGMLVLEGRTPQQSDRGRIEGKHCSTSKGKLCHTCDDTNEEVRIICIL